MTLLDAPTTTVADFKRDRWGRPLIVPAGGGKAKPYTRASSAAKAIEDTFNLELWARRNVVFGMAHDPSLVARTVALGGTPHTWDADAKKAANAIAEDASKVAQAHRAADIGTALHAILEAVNRGQDIDPGPFRADVEAWLAARDAMGWTVDPSHVECQLACDALELAGTADMIVNGTHIADFKTGATVEYATLGHAAQLAAYSRSDLYDIATDERQRLELNASTGYIVHIPAGSGTCTIHALDLDAGWRAATLAAQVREIRKAAKTWSVPVPWDVPGFAEPTPTPDRRQALRDRRQALRDRLAAFADIDRAKFADLKADRAIDPDDLDAIEALIDECDPFAVVVPPVATDVPVAPVSRPAPVLDDDITLDPAEAQALRDRAQALPADAQQILRWIVTSAASAGYPIRLDDVPSLRRWLIVDALVTHLSHGWNEDTHRALVAAVTDDPSVEQPAVPIGAVVGALTIDQARRLGEMTAALG